MSTHVRASITALPGVIATLHGIKTLCGVRRQSALEIVTVLRMIKFPVPVPFRSGSGKVIFFVISTCFAKLKSVVHILEPVETSSDSASYQASNYVQRS